MTDAPHTTPQPWQRRADERAYHYAAFRAYLDMGAGRSLTKLTEYYEQQSDSESAAKIPSKNLRTLSEWSRKFDWVQRVDAYEDHLAAIEREEIEDRAREWIRRELDDAESMLTRWGEAWQTTPYHEQDVEREVDDPQHPGQKMRVVIVRANVGKMRNLTGWRKDISDQGRRALNLPDRITEQRQQHSGEIKTGENWKAFLAALRAANQALKDEAEAQGDDPPDWD